VLPNNKSTRLVVVSNRLPFHAVQQSGKVKLQPGGGGLVRALDPVLRRTGGVWIGWPGDGGSESFATAAATKELPYDLIPVDLTAEETAGHYEGFTNRTLWPLFHDMVGRTTFESSWWETYVRVNHKFAETASKHLKSEDLVWVHDFHLFLFANALRPLREDIRYSFFLHTPFPPPSIFHRLPWRREIADALLDFDTLGFQTECDLSAFAQTITVLCPNARPLRIADRSADWQRGDRTIRARVLPISIDFQFWDSLARTKRVINRADKFRAKNAHRKIIVGVDRLDYTKGIPQRLRGFEKLLEKHPEEHEKVQFLQIAVPSRSSMSEYKELKREIERLIGQINGRFGTPDWVPVNYLYRSFAPAELSSYYQAADVAMVTSIKDGMNLVAKEFCAASTTGKGVAIVSEFAGAACEMSRGALIVNPHDTDGVADALHQALHMPPAEEQARLEALRSYLAVYDVHRWADDFVEVAKGVQGRRREPEEVLSGWSGWQAPEILLYIAYDGTLVPLRPHPSLGAPDTELVEILDHLASLPGVTLVISSGRALDELTPWFPNPATVLIGGHGAAWRHRGESSLLLAQDWLAATLAAAQRQLEGFANSVAGFVLEDKRHSIAVHYSMLTDIARQRFVPELRSMLEGIVEKSPTLRVLEGHRFLELSPCGIDKGLALEKIRRELGHEDRPIAAIGDDATDEEMFRVVGDTDLSIHVGLGPTAAGVVLSDSKQVRALLSKLAGWRLARRHAAENHRQAAHSG
jgi:trehalose 6-phosphate synthase/phosphatase